MALYMNNVIQINLNCVVCIKPWDNLLLILQVQYSITYYPFVQVFPWLNKSLWRCHSPQAWGIDYICAYMLHKTMEKLICWLLWAWTASKTAVLTGREREQTTVVHLIVYGVLSVTHCFCGSAIWVQQSIWKSTGSHNNSNNFSIKNFYTNFFGGTKAWKYM